MKVNIHLHVSCNYLDDEFAGNYSENIKQK